MEQPPDGIGGTDGTGSTVNNVTPLFKGQATALPAAPGINPELVAGLAQLLAEAQAGKINGAAIVAFYENQFTTGTYGRCHYTQLVGGLEDLKIEILLQQRAQFQRPLK